MNVIHVISGLRSGGAEHFALELCRQSLEDKEANVSVLTLSAANDISHKFEETGIKVITTARSQKNRRSFSAFKGFSVLLNHPYNIVHAHMFHACFIACCAKLLRPSLKIIFTLHNNHIPQFHRRFLLFLTRALRHTDIIFPGLKRKWFQKRNAAVVPNGINATRFMHLHIDKPPLFTCAFIGRLSPEKNPLFLIDIARSLAPEHNFIIRVAGDGPQRKELESAISDEKLQKHFVIHGYVDDVTTLLAESHCLLIPSLWEGMPLVLLEAGAAGIPVIATPVGNIPALLTNENGYVGETGLFTSMITRVMDNYGDALIKARRLMKEVMDHYSIEEVYKQHRAIYLQR